MKQGNGAKIREQKALANQAKADAKALADAKKNVEVEPNQGEPNV